MEYVRPVDFTAFKPAEFHSQRIADRGSGLESCICICTRVPPGAGTTGGLHTHPADQFYYILTGTMHAEIDGRQFTAVPGDLVFIPAGTPHWNWNSGAEDEVHFELIVPSPPPGEPIAARIAAADGGRPGPTAERGSGLVVSLDPGGFAAERFSQITLRSRANGSHYCRFMVARVPAGGSGPPLHVHTFDQIYYVIKGTMQLEIGLRRYTAAPHTLVVLPAGMPHRNWNEGPDEEMHINLQVPEATPGEPADLQVHFTPIGAR
jgi:quercetin dioxygenase-like cupin family protein